MKKIWPILIVASLIGAGLVVYYKTKVVHVDGVPAHQAHISSLIIALLAYQNEFMQFPPGDTKDIVSALQGQNSKQIEFIRMQNQEAGVIRDPWRTPYKINIVSNQITISSAGSDCVWNTQDDVKKTRKTEQ